MPREFSRSQRMGAQILRSLSELLRFDTKDPGLVDVSLTAVELSRDCSVARVYFSLLNPEAEVAPVEDGLKRAAGFLRTRLGSTLKVRHIPELRFFHDNSIAHGAEIARLIDNATRTNRKS